MAGNPWIGVNKGKSQVGYPGKLQPFQIDEIINRVSHEEMIRLEAFSHALWAYMQKSRGHCDCTRTYWNPIKKILFIGYEGVKFKSKRFFKKVPMQILPKGWRVIIRNVWDDKEGYDYFTGESIPFDSVAFDELEDTIVSLLEYSFHNNLDLQPTYQEIDDFLKKWIDSAKKGIII